MKEDNMVNETQQPVEQTVQETTPVAPAPEVAPVAPTPEVAPTPVAPIEPVATEPVQMEGPKKKKSILPALIVIIIILLLLGGAAYYLFVMNTNNPVYKMFVKENTTTTTVEKMSKIEATEKVLALYNKNVDDTLLLYNVCGISAIEELNIESAEYKALELPEGNCNGFYQPVKNYKSLEEVKKHIGGYYTEALTEDVAKSFLV